MKAHLVGAAVVAAGLGLAGPALAQDMRFVVVSHGQASDPFWSVVKNGVDQAAADLGVNVEYRAPGTFDMVQMAQLIDAAVASQPDGLVVSIPDAEAKKKELRHKNEQDGPAFKIKDDPRITKIGKLLRKTSIDELPQLWNVLKGDMSLVGPRPPIPEQVARYERWQRRRLAMQPGLTCLWQVSGRNELDFDQWMKLDLAYIDNWSPWLDLKILLRTVPVVLSGRGAS